ncbi:dihydrofolate reductase family protein [Sphingomonas sp.]|jgi:dihydrofolate reductase|uniref:dihydrofolate reductase family protein n=1 Tax=Sphingomonas sp. TaxID=28214 RepID=UPI002DEF2726|nr:dihydrofolate reductase family protein [Sphingomonas sp.]HEV2567227.1 dihydrofolate reductase family protein [Sphingomonas sp.]
MAQLVFGMNVSLDGYVDHDRFAPSPGLFRHFVAEAEGQVGSLYGRRVYALMRYWEEDQPGWGADERAFAAAWRRQSKWVVSRTLGGAGPKARLLGVDDLAAEVRRLKESHAGEIEVAGPALAGSLSALGLIDEYRLYLHPVVLGGGTPYFAGARPPLLLLAHDLIDGDVIRLRYVPA